MAARPRQALVLDFGGVISRTLFETHPLTEAALGLPPGTLGWRGPFAPQTDPLWRSMQAGDISERDYWRTRSAEVGRLLGEEWTDMVSFVRRARGADPDAVIRPEAVAAIEAAKTAGHTVAILSNELDLFYGADFRERLAFMPRVDVVVDATHTGILKPDPRAYAAIMEALWLPAEACVFVDDQPRNVEGAKRAGMRTVAFDVRRPGRGFSDALALLGLPAATKEPHHA